MDGMRDKEKDRMEEEEEEEEEEENGTLWNLSSYEPLKMVIINHGLQTMTNEVIIPHSGWEHEPNEDSKPRDAEWTTVFKNTSGCLRNVSSDGAEARRRLRECEGLVDALLHALQSAVGKKDMDNKSVENCVCIMRNLSYHVHKEVPGAEKFQDPSALQAPGSAGPQRKKKDDAGCFGGKKAKEEWFNQGECPPFNSFHPSFILPSLISPPHPQSCRA
ncbi:Armadillo repeat protein deleted in velo-cardio-facial syndrome [Takifugu flavidus]|uniref:Armadillo repeat protein deleted in velo-cardio-facial syndrome n=1 Tax=Takifugu flavidus TaxID=433684 RepID=A0A5C6MZZ3_9TELE|nr:Armadillo repeat protein deleted in velo-cardio-facial syndrome [Takifugu flavidus]